MLQRHLTYSLCLNSKMLTLEWDLMGAKDKKYGFEGSGGHAKTFAV